MTEILKFEAQAKTGNGKSQAKAVRKEGMVPAIIYGGAHKEVMITLPLNEFFTEYRKGNMQSKLTEITLAGKTITTLIRAVQLHPVTDVPLHVDLQEVSKDTVIRVAVRVKVVNDDKSAALKRGAVLNILSRTIDVFCSPHAIPKQIEVDVAELMVGRSVHINDLTLPNSVTPCDKSNFVVLTLSGSTEDTGEEKEAATAAE